MMLAAPVQSRRGRRGEEMSVSTRGCLPLAVVLGCAASSLVQAGSIEGAVSVAGKPVADALIKFADPRGMTGTVYSDAQGLYRLETGFSGDLKLQISVGTHDRALV
jgi:hypothetical protein